MTMIEPPIDFFCFGEVRPSGPLPSHDAASTMTADYLHKRERAERAAAKRARCSSARRAHQELAQLYALGARHQKRRSGASDELSLNEGQPANPQALTKQYGADAALYAGVRAETARALGRHREADQWEEVEVTVTESRAGSSD